MVDHIVDASERRGGVDIRVGVGRRRRWRAEDKGRIVAAAEEAPMFVPVVTTIREVGAAEAATNGPGSIVIEIAGARVRAQRGVDLGWLRDVLRAVKAAT